MEERSKGWEEEQGEREPRRGGRKRKSSGVIRVYTVI